MTAKQPEAIVAAILQRRHGQLRGLVSLGQELELEIANEILTALAGGGAPSRALGAFIYRRLSGTSEYKRGWRAGYTRAAREIRNAVDRLKGDET